MRGRVTSTTPTGLPVKQLKKMLILKSIKNKKHESSRNLIHQACLLHCKCDRCGQTFENIAYLVKLKTKKHERKSSLHKAMDTFRTPVHRFWGCFS